MSKNDPNIREAEQQIDAMLKRQYGVGQEDPRPWNPNAADVAEAHALIATQRQQSAQAARREILNDFTDWTELPIIKRDCDQVTLRILQIAINKRLAALGDVVGEQQ